MNSHRRLCVTTFAWTLCVTPAFAQALVDPGFENYVLSAGGFLKPSSGPWIFNNDAGVVEPFSAPSSTGVLNSWSAAFAPIEGSQYASAYAGSDWFDQSVFFPTAGDYVVSVYAASPGGTAILNGGIHQLVTGDFRFAVGGRVTGPTFTPPLDAGWSRYSTTVNIPSAGNRLIGFHTIKTASYFINFDAFSVKPVPEPSAVALAAGGTIAGLFRALGRRCRQLP